MVQAIENWTDIDGAIAGVLPELAGSTQTVVLLDVQARATVDGFPDLLGEVVGTTLEVRIRDGSAAGVDLQVGRHLHARVQRVGPTAVVAHPDHLRCDDV